MNNTISPIGLSRVDPNVEFAEWLAAQSLSESSQKIYSSMFAKFARWLSANGLSLEDCGEKDIEHFLNESQLVKEHRYRYIRLLERLYVYLLVVKKMKIENPGSNAARAGIGLGNNDQMHFLTTGQCDAIAKYISAPQGEGVEGKIEKIEKQKRSRHWTSFAEWRSARDKALAATILFGGAKVVEASLLSVNCITIESHLKIPQNAGVPYHESLILPEGWSSVLRWLKCRDKEGFPTKVLFPSNDLGEPMHPASIYRRVREVTECAFELAGLDIVESRLSPQTLRNTYAGMLFQRGLSDRSIMASLGIKSLQSIARIRAAYEVSLNR